MKNPTPLLSFTFKAIPACLLLTLLLACAHYSLMNLQDELQTNVYQFNKRLEGKMIDLSAGYVSLAKRKDFLINSKDNKRKSHFL